MMISKSKVAAIRAVIDCAIKSGFKTNTSTPPVGSVAAAINGGNCLHFQPVSGWLRYSDVEIIRRVLNEVPCAEQLTAMQADFVYHLTHPYVIVLGPEGAGYLDRNYQYLVSVRQHPPVTQFVEKEPQHIASSFGWPDWVDNADSSLFDSYWLY